MNLNNMKNIVIVKDLPSNLVEEAIIVVKDRSKIKNVEELAPKKEKNGENSYEYCFMKEEDFNKIKNIQRENRKYIVKEAEMVVSDYLDKIDENKKSKEKIKFKKTYKKLKYANLCLTLTSIISTMICILK